MLKILHMLQLEKKSYSSEEKCMPWKLLPYVVETLQPWVDLHIIEGDWLGM